MRKMIFPLSLHIFTLIFILVSYRSVECTSSKVAQSLWTLCVYSSEIVKAEIINTSSGMDYSDSTRFSIVNVRIIDKYKGDLKINDIVRIRFNVIYKHLNFITGPDPVFSKNENALLFLTSKIISETKSGRRKPLNNTYVVCGQAEGKFRIFRNSLTQEEFIIREIEKRPLEIQSTVDHPVSRKEYSTSIINMKVEIPEKFKKLNNKINVNHVDAFPLKDFKELIDYFVRIIIK